MKSRPATLPRLAALALACALAAACGPREKVVKIAVATPLTGDTGAEGQGIKRAVIMAVEEANASHRFPFKLAAAPFDDRADPKEAVNVANLIISDPRIIAVVGHYTSGCSIPAAKVYARAPIAMISPGATNPEVTAQQLSPDWIGPRVVFRDVPTDDVQGAYAAEFVYKRLGKRRMALLHDKTPYGQGLIEQFQATFQALGGKIVSLDGISVGDRDFKALLTKIKSDSARPQGIYFGGYYTEAGLMLMQMRELGMKDPFIFVSDDGAQSPVLYDVAGDAADGAYLTTVGVPVEELPSARAFIAAYKKRWTSPSEDLKPFDHFAYEATNIVLAALEKAGEPDREKVLAALPSVRYKGILGETIFDAKGDTLNHIVTMTRARAKDRSFPSVR
ncbi:MAG: branched-chain amino acid ABC transporter substrate-binding protein [Elusimicrobia bacterium]|nr:branched-chain amino acid ABC transporter substrate-binding protein [Elusimicrobiota bacterium]